MNSQPFTLRFSCPRSCRRCERVDLCRFLPVLSAGTVTVNSHTATVRVEFRDRDALGRAAERMGGRVIGEGEHRLFSTNEKGFAVQLPNWKFPIILREDGKLAFDNYNGAWGATADLESLTSAYAVEAARAAATAQGWMVQDETDGSLIVFHPDGGTLTVSAGGKLEASGFTGSACHAPSEILTAAMGTVTSMENKPDFYVAAEATVGVQE